MIFKKIVFILFLQFSLFANSVYNLNFLDFQAKVFPKIILLDNNFEDKLIKNSVVLTILYEEIDYNITEILKDKIVKEYKSLKDYHLEVNSLKYSEFNINKLSTAYILLLGKDEKILEISKILTNNSRLTFAYDNSYLDLGVIFGLSITSKVDIFLNLEALKNSKIELQNSIFSVVKIR
ncbi:hypothetical protein AN286_02760 [Aliarcobacter cryaerophilus ATCC 43158]|uniref:DUF4154 domain-containing protein n=1 Tax=Aliarcobacter cryaerophilus ATCC 43158 TaxID=1032070 RepID=A0AAD0TYJ4_9BACT|nr:hypothetical protein [Aliarcobacter cryaerophilus]AYJ81058.1 hypothetical protein ACRYA_1970 [Aliarcobacter cryaerophilus ATCC 43158]PRM96510.1 hypothetical protein CJ667_07730 [Aliarcobacter cryaerophilus]QCZ23376.1 hypothetical protein AN286_02760 [Aliarcobacter cryaerophilus ATCC 43158]